MTCSELGWNVNRGADPLVCGASNLNHDGTTGMDSNTCLGADNSATDGFAHAAAICSGAGGRLCTIEEIMGDETQGTGCGHDGDQVWTSSTCDSNGDGEADGMATAQGNANNGVQCQTDLAQNLAVRCCADTVVDPANTCGACTSALSCGDLSWGRLGSRRIRQPIPDLLQAAGQRARLGGVPD